MTSQKCNDMHEISVHCEYNIQKNSGHKQEIVYFLEKGYRFFHAVPCTVLPSDDRIAKVH